jgi:hypothetical protein
MYIFLNLCGLQSGLFGMAHARGDRKNRILLEQPQCILLRDFAGDSELVVKYRKWRLQANSVILLQVRLRPLLCTLIPTHHSPINLSVNDMYLEILAEGLNKKKYMEMNFKNKLRGTITPTTSGYTQHMSSRWYKPNLHVVTIDMSTFIPPCHQGFYSIVKFL